jgi:amino acid transporter
LRNATNKMRLLPLIGATYFMVAGGPYGIEDIIGDAGYGRALLLLLVIPIIWSLPTSLMVGELASALPEEGGYYCWVRRALGSFWGFQEAWLSLAASIFDMAIYPVTFVLYLSRVAPNLTAGYRGTLWALAVVIACAAWNLRGAKAVGEGSVGMFAVLLAPFVVLVGVGFWKGLFAPSHVPDTHDMAVHALTFGDRLRHGITLLKAPVAAPSFAGAVSIALWNYMGWDNASTVAQEVEAPQRNYPRAMLISAALVAATYIVPLAAVGLAGIPADQFSTGAWTDAARSIAGPGAFGTALMLAVVIGGMLNGAGMFNALMLSYARVPFALAKDGLLPRFLTRTTVTQVPWALCVSLRRCVGPCAPPVVRAPHLHRPRPLRRVPTTRVRSPRHPPPARAGAGSTVSHPGRFARCDPRWRWSRIPYRIRPLCCSRRARRPTPCPRIRCPRCGAAGPLAYLLARLSALRQVSADHSR